MRKTFFFLVLMLIVLPSIGLTRYQYHRDIYYEWEQANLATQLARLFSMTASYIRMYNIDTQLNAHFIICLYTYFVSVKFLLSCHVTSNILSV